MPLAALLALAVVAHIDAGKHHLEHAFGGQFAGLRHHLVEWGGTAYAAGHGNGAVGADVVAAVLNL